MTVIGVPSTVNHYPVVAAVLKDGGPDVVEGHVMCQQVGTQDEGDRYCTWHVWLYTEDVTPGAVERGWIAENGRYDMAYTDALVDFAHRAGMTVIGE